jgi:uncharacterized protein (TIGR00251 family)
MRENRRTPQTVESGCIIQVRVIPRSSKISIENLGPELYKIKLTSPPIDGAANEQLLKVLAKRLSISTNQIRILSGQTSRIKRIMISGVAPEDLPSLISDKHKK